jgi:hypothetical protein
VIWLIVGLIDTATKEAQAENSLAWKLPAEATLNSGPAGAQA